MSNEILKTEVLDFEIVPDDLGLELTAKNSLELAFGGFFSEAARWEKEAASITDPKLARTARLELKALRISAEKKRKELKADSLRMGKAIDGANNILLSLVVPIEKSLDDIEKQEERRIAAEKAEQLEERNNTYAPFHDELMPHPALGEMTDDQFAEFLKNAETIHTLKKEVEAKTKADRLKKEKEELEAREQQRLENIKLKKEAEAREKELAIERAAAEKARQEQEAKAAQERAEIEAKAKKEAEAREKAEAESRALKAAEEERRQKEKDEAEAAAKIEADKIKAREQAEKKAAAAPSKDKLMKFAAQVRALEVPKLDTEEAQKVAEEVASKVANFAAWIEKQAKTI